MGRPDKPSYGEELAEHADGDRGLFAHRASVRERRERLYSLLMKLAQQTSMENRAWFCLSEIADACARVPGEAQINHESRAQVIEWLQASVLRGEFDSSREGQTRLAFLHAAPNATLHFERVWAEDFNKWKIWTDFSPTSWNPWEPPQQWPVTIWMRRDDCAAWLDSHNIVPPADWHLDESGEVGDYYLLPRERPPGNKAATHAYDALLKWRGRRIPRWPMQRLANAIKPILKKMGQPPVSQESVARALGKRK
jgi:hypothetical protein